ncbi:hypothetical protein [Phenylobacterium sp.]|uniref:hypothetical protein n=1 Tax=Phenylobacterium sp. TaxID=1871053 RepID=UPI00271D886B|nr:hypothetical protein [Phenylobacterium sp.]MDO8801079.1 hypothetical protein [Phenylobacterium sp.]
MQHGLDAVHPERQFIRDHGVALRGSKPLQRPAGLAVEYRIAKILEAHKVTLAYRFLIADTQGEKFERLLFQAIRQRGKGAPGDDEFTHAAKSEFNRSESGAERSRGHRPQPGTTPLPV